MQSMFRLLFILSIFVVAACTRQQPAPIDYRGNYFYGKEGGVDKEGNALPKYSASNPAPETEYNAEKYTAPVEQYGVAADVGEVAASDLPAPNAAPAVPENLAPLEETAVQAEATPSTAPPQDSYAPLNVQQPVTVTQSAAPQNFVWPLKGKVISSFSQNQKGLSIAARAGEPIRAVADGTVLSTSSSGAVYSAMIDHGGGWTSSYGNAGDVVVKKGDRVVQGQLLGFVGKASGGKESQLTFSLTENAKPVDPESRLK